MFILNNLFIINLILFNSKNTDYNITLSYRFNYDIENITYNHVKLFEKASMVYNNILPLYKYTDKYKLQTLLQA